MLKTNVYQLYAADTMQLTKIHYLQLTDHLKLDQNRKLRKQCKVKNWSSHKVAVVERSLKSKLNINVVKSIWFILDMIY